MKKSKKGLLAIVLSCFVMSMTACSFEGTVDNILSKIAPKKNTAEEEPKAEETPKVDVAKPELTADISGSFTYAPDQEATALTIAATISDGGTLSYQWYRNMTNTNGGGTPIEGATTPSFTPPTAEVGTTYYYAVATNKIETSINGITSATAEVIVSEEAVPQTEEGQTNSDMTSAAGWKQDDSGWWYENDDGSFTKSDWKQIDGKWYAFDDHGYIRTGWFQDGESWFYLNKDGSMAVNTDVEGYHLNEDGKMAQ